MGLLKEFRDFAVRGNVVDMAVGVVIGGAFGQIVTSLVNDMMMPPIGKLTGGLDFKTLSYTLQQAVVDAQGKITTPAVEIRYGAFINTIINFLIVAFCMFMVIKAMNSTRLAQELSPKAADAPEEIRLLREIRDSLAKR